MIFVTRGIIVKDNCILAAQRPASMSLPFKWELPGGKCETGESAPECLVRETMEEMGLEVIVLEGLPHVDREFRGKHYRMLPFLCEETGGKLFAYEHEQAVWWPINRLWELDWGPAEKMLLESWVKFARIEVPATELVSVG